MRKLGWGLIGFGTAIGVFVVVVIGACSGLVEVLDKHPVVWGAVLGVSPWVFLVSGLLLLERLDRGKGRK